MDSTIVIRKSALDYFRAKARECPNEIQAYMIGEIIYPNKIIVDSVEYPREYATQTSCEVSITDREWQRVKKLAEERGKRIVGDIHSHPNWDAVMSPQDMQACIEDGVHVCGIVSVNERRTRARFWLVNSALPCDIKYASVSKKSRKNS